MLKITISNLCAQPSGKKINDFNLELFWVPKLLWWLKGMDLLLCLHSGFQYRLQKVVMLIYLKLQSLFINFKKNLVNFRELWDLGLSGIGRQDSRPVLRSTSSLFPHLSIPEGGISPPFPGLGTSLLQLPEPWAWIFQVCTQDEDFPLSSSALPSLPSLPVSRCASPVGLSETACRAAGAPKWPVPP